MDEDPDPTMPARPPIAALRAITTIKAFRSWEPVEIYRAIREALRALREPQEFAPAPRPPATEYDG